jgi:serine/threonine protein kinase/tetratricopeptide (TPR) repeat protein
VADHRQLRVKEIFQAAVQRDPTERSAFLDQPCGGDAALRTAVESLLAAGEDAGDFLENPPLLSAGGLDPATLGSSGSEPARVIDRYRLLEKIGAGGMGEVWLAEQQEPVHRHVALKVIKAGMDTAQVIARFEAERQALAIMDHPAIARVFDAGATPAGRPYFVMEHVTGFPITQHCDEKRLGIVARLELFVQVCEGVQHAHQKAILHRDLKPSNVLVATQDGRSVPKIIDFGVAKAMTQPLTVRTLHTGLGMLIGTPGYMSPEQANLAGRDVDTRTDVYSLGVMLYELQVGVLPFDAQKLRTAGWEGLGRLLREEEPATPSRRLTTLPPEVSAESTAHRQVDLPTLRRQLAGDLDWITMKAIEPNRERRYGTPLELAEDIRRHLRDEPVLAGSQGTTYRVRKFVRRHRLGVAAAGIVMGVATAALVGVTVGLVRATRAEAEARRQAAASERVSGFLSNLLASVDAERMGRALVHDLRERVRKAEPTKRAPFEHALRGVSSVDVARSLVDREILSRAGRTIDEEMGNDPLLAARLQATLGSTYHKLGLFGTAESFQLKALETRRRLLGPENPFTLRSMTEVGRTRARQGHTAAAEHILGEALQIQRRVLGGENPDTLSSMQILASVMLDQNRFQEAEDRFRTVLELRGRVLGEDHPETAISMRTLANCIMQRSRFEPGASKRYHEAEALYRRVLDRQRRDLGIENEETLLTMNNLANTYFLRDRFPEAERLYAEVLDRRRRLFGDDHSQTAMIKGNLAAACSQQRRYGEAERHYMEAIDGLRRMLGEGHKLTLVMMYSLAGSYADEGRFDQAEPFYEAAIAGMRRNHGESDSQTLAYISAMADRYRLHRRYDEAARLYREVLDLVRRSFGEDDFRTLTALRNLARVHFEAGDVSQARTEMRTVLAARKRASEGPDAGADARIAYARELLTCQPADLRDPQQALEPALQAAAATGRRDPNVLSTLALAYHSLGREDDAVRTAREARAALPEGPSPLRPEIEASLARYEKASAGSIRP